MARIALVDLSFNIPMQVSEFPHDGIGHLSGKELVKDNHLMSIGSSSVPVTLVCCAGLSHARLVKELPLLRRKRSPVLYVDHIEAHGRHFFEKVCELDLEGIVGEAADNGLSSDGEAFAVLDQD
jgi:hypothetical protein